MCVFVHRSTRSIITQTAGEILPVHTAMRSRSELDSQAQQSDYNAPNRDRVLMRIYELCADFLKYYFLARTLASRLDRFTRRGEGHSAKYLCCHQISADTFPPWWCRMHTKEVRGTPIIRMYFHSFSFSVGAHAKVSQFTAITHARTPRGVLENSPFRVANPRSLIYCVRPCVR